MNVPEERQTGRERIDVQAPRNSSFNVSEPVRECKRELLRGGGTCFANVVAADRDRIPLRNVLGGPLEAVHDKSEGRLDRIHPGVLGHVLFQDVVLNRSAQPVRIHSLLLGGGDVETIENDRRPVDGHRRRDLVERNAVKEHLHVGEAGDCHSALAYLALRSRMIRVVTHQRREIEGD